MAAARQRRDCISWCSAILAAVLLAASAAAVILTFSAAGTVRNAVQVLSEGKSGVPAVAQPRRRCDLSSGVWVHDNSSALPLYSEKGCPFVSDILACERFGREDLKYQHWRWQPHGCDLPRFSGELLLEKLRGKRLVFVGDSLNWNQWLSLVCLVDSSIPAAARDLQKTMQPSGSLKTFTVKEYNASIEFYWAPLLVESNSDDPVNNQFPERIVRADSIQKHGKRWADADVLVFNSYLWWRKSTIKVQWGSFDDPEATSKNLTGLQSFDIAMRTWSDWVEFNVNRTKTQIFFMTMSPTHFRGEEWGAEGGGRNCYNESEPIKEYGHRSKDSDKNMMKILEESLDSLRARGVAVQVLNITQLSEYRKDGHQSIYRQRWEKLTPEQLAHPASYADCIHWCLPGVPDVWNQILYSHIVGFNNEEY